MIRFARLGLIAVTILAFGQAATAHALMSASDPASGATLDRPPQTITLTFTEEPEPSLSSVRVLLPTGQPASQGSVQTVPGRPRTLLVAVGPLAAGVYTVAWRTVSKVDGHVTGGAFAFGVSTSPANVTLPQVASPPPSLLGGGGRWALYAGLSVLLGASWVWTIALPSFPSLASRWTYARIARAVPRRLGAATPPRRPRRGARGGKESTARGRVLDAYLDPGRAGLNEVHATYIDAAGHEMPLPHLATMTANRPGGTPAPFPVRRFGPGHFIGDAQLPRGEWELTFTVTTAAGEVLRSHLPVRL